MPTDFPSGSGGAVHLGLETLTSQLQDKTVMIYDQRYMNCVHGNQH